MQDASGADSGAPETRDAHVQMETDTELSMKICRVCITSQHEHLQELCAGDPGTLSVSLSSEFPYDITLESVSLTLTATNNADARVKAIRTCGSTILNTGRNTITLSLPPQKPGSYVLGVLTGQICHLRFRSHGYSRSGPVDNDDLMSYDNPPKLILKVKASLTTHDALLDLKDGFTHTTKGDGRPTSNLFPLAVPATSRTGILFSILMEPTITEAEWKVVHPDTILNIKYGISGDRNLGSHTPMSLKKKGPEDDVTPLLNFRSVAVLKRPVLEPLLVVGFVPLPPNGLRVGQLITMKWRVERVKSFEEEIMYEVNASPEKWMIAGRKRGHATLSGKQGSIIEISILCVPLAVGYVHPPQLDLQNVNRANICCNTVAANLVCVLPSLLNSSFCISA